MPDIRQTPLRDNFNRANENPLAAPWQRDWGSRINMKLLSNHIVSTSSSPTSGGWAYWSTQSFTGPMEAWATTVGSAPIADSSQIMLMTSGTPSGYELHMPNPVGPDKWQLWKYNAGSTSLLTSVSHSVPGANQLIMLRLTATDVEGWTSTDGGANWALIISFPETTYRTNLYITLGARGAPGWDNAGGGVPRVVRRQQIYRILHGTNAVPTEWIPEV